VLCGTATPDDLDPTTRDWLHRQLAAGPVRDTVGERMKALLADADAARPAPNGANVLPAAGVEHLPLGNGTVRH
jgi:hypothetical protein